MAYVEWHDTVRNHPKTDALMLALGIKRREAVGILACLSSWAIQYRPGGRIEREYIPVAVEWENSSDALISALIKARWIDEIDDKWVEIHHWKDVTSGYRKARKDATRKAKLRAKEKAEKDALSSTDSPRTGARSSADISRTAPRAERSDLNERNERNGTEDIARTDTNRSEPAATHPDLIELELYGQDPRLNRDWEGFRKAQEQANPSVDIIAETRKAHAWEVANPSKRKRNRKGFLSRWYARAQDKAGGNGSSHDEYSPDSALKLWRSRQIAKEAKRDA